MTDTPEPANSGSGRWDLYQWLSSVLAREQDLSSWQFHASDEFLETLAARAEEQGLGDAVDPLADYLATHRDDDTDKLLMALAVDYAQLFIGPGPGQAPPFESVYTSADGRLYGDAYANLIETLHDEGITVAEGFSAPADHAAVELAVVAYLIERGAGEDALAAASDDIDATQAAFLRTHVLNWFPRWCDDVIEHAETDFYRGVARVLAAFLERERDRVGDALPA